MTDFMKSRNMEEEWMDIYNFYILRKICKTFGHYCQSKVYTAFQLKLYFPGNYAGCSSMKGTNLTNGP